MLNSFNNTTIFDTDRSNSWYNSHDTCYSDSYVSTRRDKDNKVKIPKIIMQTWKNRNVPDKWKCSPESIKKHMPGWKYVLMTDTDNRRFVKKYFPDFLKYYDAFPYGIQRADAIRYMWLYVYGGIYMDLDFEMLHPLDHLFTSGAEVYLVNSGNVGSCITNSFMASKPGCKLWLEMIEAMKNPELSWYHMGKHMCVMNTTGPLMLNYVAKNSKIVYSVLPGKLIMPCSVCNISCDVGDAYMRPLEGSSWISYDTQFYNFFLCNWKPLVVMIVLLLLVILFSLLFQWLEWAGPVYY